MNAQTDVPVFLQKNGYAKSMANIFSCIEEGKLQKAVKEQEEIKEKFSKDKDINKNATFSAESYLYPIWQVANSLFMNTKSGKDTQKDQAFVQYDPWKAYKTLKWATLDVMNKTNVDAFFSQRKLKHTVESIKADIEANLIGETASVGTEDAYDKLMGTLYDYADLYALETKREEIAFSETMKSEKVDALQHYMDKYGSFNSTHLLKMEHRRDSVAFEQLGKNANACKQYLKSYPGSEYNDQVTRLLHRYEFESMAQTVSACKTYLSTYPQSEYAGQVKTMMARFAFDDAKRAGTPEALGDFLHEFSQSEYNDAAKQELNKILTRKFFYIGTSLCELEHFVRSREFSGYVDYTPYNALFCNLKNMPTSAAMMECKGLIGEVNYSTSEYEEVYVFDDRGLLTNHRHTRSGTNDSWKYDFNEKGEARPVSKTDNRGKTTTYKTTFNSNGLLASISGSDGTQTAFAYTTDNELKLVTYSKNGNKTRVDSYDSEGRIVRSERNGVVLAYEYNYQGDMVSMNKKRGNIVMEQTTYEYEYDDSGMFWRTMRQYNNGSFFLEKTRTFTKPEAYQKPAVKSRRKEDSGSILYGDIPAGLNSTDDVFDVVEQMPSFPGGQTALMQWLNDNIHYPVVAADNGVQGRVIIQFVVEKDGSVSGVTVAKSVDPSLDKEAQRVVKSMPKWSPGKQNGSAVRVMYTVPVTFKLS